MYEFVSALLPGSYVTVCAAVFSNDVLFRLQQYRQPSGHLQISRSFTTAISGNADVRLCQLFSVHTTDDASF